MTRMRVSSLNLNLLSYYMEFYKKRYEKNKLVPIRTDN